jgi:hypothetical protein|tara:strand:- start:705 stop:1058 length:354 start_codon:yes stop_codon:yes gene_type:complete
MDDKDDNNDDLAGRISEEEVARYVGKLIGIMEMMNEKFPAFKSLFSFQLLLSEGSYLQGANVSRHLCGSDLTELMCNVQSSYAQRYDDGMDFEMDLMDLIIKLEDDLSGEAGGEDSK